MGFLELGLAYFLKAARGVTDIPSCLRTIRVDHLSGTFQPEAVLNDMKQENINEVSQ